MYPPEPELELVTVLESTDPFAVMLARATLEEAGIGYVASGAGSTFRVEMGPLVEGVCRIQVACEFEREARVLLEPLANPDPSYRPEAGPSD